MNVVIAGAGEVGRHAAEILGAAGHNITVIDLSADKLRKLEDTLDIRSLRGNCAHAEIISEAGGATCDLFLAATNSDEINLLTASVAKGLGARKCLARVHHSAYFGARGIDYQAHLGIDRLICPDYLTGRAIARTLRNPGAMALENFARGAIEMQQLRIDKTDPALDVPLSELALPDGVRVFTHIVNADADKLAMDMAVKLCVAILGEDEGGAAVESYAFTPDPEGGG